MTSPNERPSRARHLLPLLLLGATIAIGACGAAPAAATQSDGRRAPTPSPNATMAGPTPFAAWTARQGFGGGAGIAEVQKGAAWLLANTGASDRATWTEWWSGMADGLAFWLDVHPATECWAAFHETARQAIGRIQDDFVPIRTAVGAGKNVPGEPATDMVKAAAELVALKQPTGCE
jgi:hypothetical protein